MIGFFTKKNTREFINVHNWITVPKLTEYSRSPGCLSILYLTCQLCFQLVGWTRLASTVMTISRCFSISKFDLLNRGITIYSTQKIDFQEKLKKKHIKVRIDVWTSRKKLLQTKYKGLIKTCPKMLIMSMVPVKCINYSVLQQILLLA